ncbi:unnamed protein product [Clonostachys solani]|uniref:Uncharacterized protein n=1 Tax=Clonostachys solani TaxID=160281 RepID=A0A9N9ZQ61_9HYPO|nr:unnamed protein product [Clonostachys solani]
MSITKFWGDVHPPAAFFGLHQRALKFHDKTPEHESLYFETALGLALGIAIPLGALPIAKSLCDRVSPASVASSMNGGAFKRLKRGITADPSFSKRGAMHIGCPYQATNSIMQAPRLPRLDVLWRAADRCQNQAAQGYTARCAHVEARKVDVACLTGVRQ